MNRLKDEIMLQRFNNKMGREQCSCMRIFITCASLRPTIPSTHTAGLMFAIFHEREALLFDTFWERQNGKNLEKYTPDSEKYESLMEFSHF